MNIVNKKYWFFLISTLVIVPGVISLLMFGLRLGIDFSGGSLMELKIQKSVPKNELETFLKEKGVEVSSLTETGFNTYILRTVPLEDKKVNEIMAGLNNKFGKTSLQSFDKIGPTIGQELLQKALLSLLIASVAIVFYIAYSFRKVPKPASSWRFGIAAIIALLHDVLVVVGVFSLLGHFYQVEIDSMFVTALLTVIGFSVHDTIVVFDRIRENLIKGFPGSFAEIVNHSILQTLGRSLNTSLTVVLVLLALLLFGGINLRWFVVALLVGIISGTYSSIFNAAPILVVWQEFLQKRRSRH